MKKKSLSLMLSATAFLLFMQPLFAQAIQHAIQLQVADVVGAPVENTAFWITVDIVKKQDEITLSFPTLNFQIGQCAGGDPDCTYPQPGYIITTGGYLPPDLRPNSLLPISFSVASGDGLAQTGDNGDDPPTPPPGFIILIDNSGSILIQQAGAAQNALSTGPHIVLPCSVTYKGGKREQIGFNFPLSEGGIDVTQFTGGFAGDNIRDSHINDAFDDVFAWAWTDNHNVDPTANTLNVFVVVGQIDRKGRLKLGKPIQLTDLPPNQMGWDTSVAINRQDKNNIVVSYGVISSGVGDEVESNNGRAVSFDGGKTWGGVFDGVNSSTYNGLINYQTATGFGDIPGVAADQYGNFWYGITETGADETYRPYLLISSDKGVTWNLAYTFPAISAGAFYDYPHLVFGGSGNGEYGVLYYADYYDVDQNIYPTVTFIPINGLGSMGTPSNTFLNVFPNSVPAPAIAVSNGGRFWALGASVFDSTFYYNTSVVSMFKSPGALDENYAGPWLVGSQNQLNNTALSIYQFDSTPITGYFISVQGLIYDDKRAALYALFSAQSPPLSQNMRLYFSISRNNGLTWSDPYDISTSSFANRGFDSMALDSETGNLYIGWYDGRNDPSMKKLQYFGGIIPAQLLDKLVSKIPTSNPLFAIPDQGSPTPPP